MDASPLNSFSISTLLLKENASCNPGSGTVVTSHEVRTGMELVQISHASPPQRLLFSDAHALFCTQRGQPEIQLLLAVTKTSCQPMGSRRNSDAVVKQHG